MLLSLVTINYNNSVGLKNTIESIRHELNHECEYIVVDGASTDGSSQIISNYSAIFSKVIQEPDDGIYDAINKGIKASNGQWIMLIHSGDLILQGMLPLILRTLERKDQLVINYAPVATSISGVINGYIGKPPEFLLDGMIPHQGTIVNKYVYEKLGLYSLEYRLSADYDAFLRYYLEGVEFKPLNIVFCSYDMSGLSQSRWDIVLSENKNIKLKYHIIENIKSSTFDLKKVYLYRLIRYLYIGVKSRAF